MALALVVACATPRRIADRGWILVHPPEVDDPNAPRGRRLLPMVPVGSWARVADFPTEAACDEARRVRAETAIDRARAASGEDARYDLDVRRAVNARCVAAEAAGGGGLSTAHARARLHAGRPSLTGLGPPP